MPSGDRKKAQKDKDYSREVTQTRNPLLRYALIAAGVISFTLGIIGIFLPVLPTTPFLLLSAACFARSSTAFYNWLMNNRFFGSYIRTWRTERRIPLRAKIIATLMIVLTIGSTVIYVIPLMAVKILLVAIGLTVILYIFKFPH